MQLVAHCCPEHFEFNLQYSPSRWDLNKVVETCEHFKKIWVCGPPLMNEEFLKKFESEEKFKRKYIIF
jgi:NAD(P)H-flavin reductase